MKANKLKYLSSGNMLFSNYDGVNDISVKGFMDVTGADMMDGNLIRVARQNGSDFYTFNWRDIKYLEGQSGVLALPTSKVAFYTLLFTEFIIPTASSLPSGAATSAKQDYIITLLQSFATLADSQPILNKNDYFSDVALGKIATAINFKKAGGNPTVGTTQKVIKWSNSDLDLIGTASKVEFVSTSVLDTVLGGTGAQKILITGVDSDGAEQTEVLELQGNTPVTSVKSYYRVLNRVQVSQAGTTLKNQGIITGTVAGKNVCTIPAGTGLMKQLCYTVPAGKTALVHGYSFDLSKNTPASQKMDIFFYILRNGVQYEIFNFRIDLSTGIDVFITREFKTPLQFLNNDVWWLEAKSTGTAWIEGEIEQTVHNN